MSKNVTHLVTLKESILPNSPEEKAIKMGLPVVNENWVNSSIKNGELSTSIEDFL